MNPMPQNNPMTPEALSNALRECADGSDEQNTYELDDDQALAAIESRDAQLIRSTLEAAAERVCKACKSCGGSRYCGIPDTCYRRSAILAPLTKEISGDNKNQH